MENIKPRPLYALFAIVLLILIGLGGLGGGLSMILDPSGQGLGFPAGYWEELPLFNSFLIPGILLVLLFGILPLTAAVGLWRFRPVERPTGQMSNPWKLGLLCGILLIIWIAVQVGVIGFHSFLQPLLGFAGILLNWLLTTVPVRAYYSTGK